MKKQYTKGDWKICSNMAKDKRAKCFWYDIEDIHGNTIAEVKGIHYGIKNNTAEANAWLIAAAPELLEACEELFDIINIDKLTQEEKAAVLKCGNSFLKATE